MADRSGDCRQFRFQQPQQTIQCGRLMAHGVKAPWKKRETAQLFDDPAHRPAFDAYDQGVRRCFE
ncbi:hypothetical protein GGR39_000864 [Novosphingobium fluoreni]|uniref:Uncharacterized protein n=1 Tax=Novosphingobium fluoreni TaxID=1391222 RepID=A0A7W6FXC7_9SPHN|nr:hypothetical protein [Novosphingobium fluoreni]MBB3939224.1 hypothetical protein [Novosphingobium fluoreni]